MGENQRMPPPTVGRKNGSDHPWAVNVAGVEKDRAHQAQLLIERETDLLVQLDKLVAADALVGVRIPGTDISIFKAADGVNATQVELFING